MLDFSDCEIREIVPFSVSECYVLDCALDHELRYYLNRAQIEEDRSSECSNEYAAHLCSLDASRFRNHARYLADVLFNLRLHYILHPEDPHDLL